MDEELGEKLFPKDVVEDKYMINAMLVAAKRMNTILNDRPKYKHVCDKARDMIRYFLSCIPER